MLERRDLRLLLWAVFGLMAVAMAVSFVGWRAWDWGAGGFGMMGGWMWMPFLLLMLVLMLAMGGMGGMRHGHSHGGDDARSILDRRYAAGELSREDYLRMRDELGRH